MKKRIQKFDNYLKGKLKDQDIKISYEEVGMHLKLARLIEDLRLKSGLTQAELAEKAGVSQPMIARLERGDQDRVPTLSTINKVLNILGYEVELSIKKAA